MKIIYVLAKLFLLDRTWSIDMDRAFSVSMATQLRYRGLSYGKDSHQQPSSRPVEHTYRGRQYVAPLLHEVAPSDKKADLCYRGHHYLSHRDHVSSAN